MSGNGYKSAPAVQRAVRILDLLASAGRPVSLTHIARELDIAKSSTANLCLALEEGALIQRTGEGYSLGRKTVELGGAYALRFNQVREFFSACAESDVLVGEVVQIAMLDGVDVLYVARHEGRAPYSLGSPIGARLPAVLTATGNAMLSTFSSERVRDFLKETMVRKGWRAQEVDIDARLDRIEVVRTRGFAIDDEETYPGLIGVAVALPPWSPSDPLLGMGASLPVDTPTSRVAEVGEALKIARSFLTNPLAVSGPSSYDAR